MLAPQASNDRVIFCFWTRVMEGAGSGSNAEAPPEIKQITRSSGPAWLAIWAMRRAPATPRWSGTGWPHSLILISLGVEPKVAQNGLVRIGRFQCRAKNSKCLTAQRGGHAAKRSGASRFRLRWPRRHPYRLGCDARL